MEIHWNHLENLTPVERSAIEERLRKLAAEHDDLIDVRIVGRSTRHHRHGAQEVRIACLARGKQEGVHGLAFPG